MTTPRAATTAATPRAASATRNRSIRASSFPQQLAPRLRLLSGTLCSRPCNQECNKTVHQAGRPSNGRAGQRWQRSPLRVPCQMTGVAHCSKHKVQTRASAVCRFTGGCLSVTACTRLREVGSSVGCACGLVAASVRQLPVLHAHLHPGVSCDLLATKHVHTLDVSGEPSGSQRLPHIFANAKILITRVAMTAAQPLLLGMPAMCNVNSSILASSLSMRAFTAVSWSFMLCCPSATVFSRSSKPISSLFSMLKPWNAPTTAPITKVATKSQPHQHESHGRSPA